MCADLSGDLEDVGQFGSFLGRELASVMGESRGVDAVTAQMDQLHSRLESVEFNPFDRNREEEWSDAMERFQARVTKIKASAGSSIEQAFRRLQSSERAFDLVQNFYTLCSGPVIHRLIDRRFRVCSTRQRGGVGRRKGLATAKFGGPCKGCFELSR